MRIDLHSHTFLSDGLLHPTEHLRYAEVTGHDVIAISDHVGVTDAARVLDVYRAEFAALDGHIGVRPLMGVEITHVPPDLIPQAAANARAAGAQIVVVHGETPDEPVLPGTNAAAVRCRDVDVLAHPGRISPENANAAVQHGVALELSGKRVHAVANKQVAEAALAAGAMLVVNSDSHSHEGFLGADAARKVALHARVPEEALPRVLSQWPEMIVARRDVRANR